MKKSEKTRTSNIKKTRITVGKQKEKVEKSRNETAHSSHFKICGSLKVVVFFKFAVFSILRETLWQNSRHFYIHIKFRS